MTPATSSRGGCGPEPPATGETRSPRPGVMFLTGRAPTRPLKGLDFALCWCRSREVCQATDSCTVRSSMRSGSPACGTITGYIPGCVVVVTTSGTPGAGYGKKGERQKTEHEDAFSRVLGYPEEKHRSDGGHHPCQHGPDQRLLQSLSQEPDHHCGKGRWQAPESPFYPRKRRRGAPVESAIRSQYPELRIRSDRPCGAAPFAWFGGNGAMRGEALALLDGSRGNQSGAIC